MWQELGFGGGGGGNYVHVIMYIVQNFLLLVRRRYVCQEPSNLGFGELCIL